MKPLLYAMVCSVALVLSSPAASTNVVLIVTDDQRWDTLAAMPTVQSELVGKGTTFPEAFVVNPLCCPSRASIFTGRWSHSTGVWGVSGAHGGFHTFDDRSTIATWLDVAGYDTALLGKYLNRYDRREAPVTYVPPGWDRWFAFWNGGARSFDYLVSDDGTLRTFGSDPSEYATDVFAAKAVEFLRQTARPFFLYLAPAAPHVRSRYKAEPAPRHVGAFAGVPPYASPSVNEQDVSDKPRYIRRTPKRAVGDLTSLRQSQLEALLAVDDAVATILDELEASGRLADTLIVLTSDNGYAWGEHRRAGKIAPYEESIRVPLVMRWDAGGLTSGEDRRLALNVDLAPTIADAVGIRAPGAEGRSLLSGFTRRGFLFEARQPGVNVPAYCAFRESWKYVQYTTGEEELYHLGRDPFELTNVARTHRPLVMSYRGRVRRSKCRPPGYDPLPLCSLTGTQRDDRIRGTWRPDWICAGGGDDTVRVVGGGRDVVRCGAGRDLVHADRRDAIKSTCERLRRS
ncbi:MAG: sulfatase family protein [Gaiellaceae bacterium]